jgi:hypothetical protein
MKEQIIKELSSAIHPQLVKELIENYEKILTEYRKGEWDNTLLSAGRFAENVFRVLHFIRTKEVVREIESIQEEIKALQSEPQQTLDESIRVIIPKIAASIPYTLRSKRNVAHIKPVDPTYIDATLSVATCDWILAELLRLYHASEDDKILEMINGIINRKIPFVEEHGSEIFITKRLGLKPEILLLLLKNPLGLDRSEIGKILGKYYAQSSITEALQGLEEDRMIGYSKDAKKYYLLGPGETEITKVISYLI